MKLLVREGSCRTTKDNQYMVHIGNFFRNYELVYVKLPKNRVYPHKQGMIIYVKDSGATTMYDEHGASIGHILWKDVIARISNYKVNKKFLEQTNKNMELYQRTKRILGMIDEECPHGKQFYNPETDKQVMFLKVFNELKKQEGTM